MSRSALEQAGLAQRTDHISDRVRQMIISPIKEMAYLASTMDDVVSFAWGIPHVPTPEHIRAGLKEALDHDPASGQYAPSLGLLSLRQAVAEKLQRDFQVTVDPANEIVISAGAMEMLMVTIQTVVNPGDEVIITDPGFASYIEQIRLAGGVPVFLPLQEENGWHFNVADLPKLVTAKTKAVIICSPNNPTGTIFTQAELDAVAEIVLQHNLLLITDEPYHFLTYGGAPCPTLFTDERLRYQRVACFSFSKEYVMTGYRVGYTVAEPGMIRQLLKMHDNTIVSAPRPSQLAALTALTGDQSCVVELRDTLEHRRNLMCQHLDELKDVVSYVQPAGSYYVFVKFLKPVDDVAFAVDLLREAKVTVVPGSAFGPHGRSHLRFCFGSTEADIHKGMERFKQYINKHY